MLDSMNHMDMDVWFLLKEGRGVGEQGRTGQGRDGAEEQGQCPEPSQCSERGQSWG